MRAKKVQESVSDKYLENNYGIPDEFDDFEKLYREKLAAEATDPEKNIVISKDGEWKLLKNPSSMAVLGSNVRGVITPDGNLYIENFSDKIHQDILEILFEKGILKTKPTKSWGHHLPQRSGFLTVKRDNDKPSLAIGESNKVVYDEEVLARYFKYYASYINKARKINPSIKFNAKLVGKKITK